MVNVRNVLERHTGKDELTVFPADILEGDKDDVLVEDGGRQRS